jgi:hypothetical protein
MGAYKTCSPCNQHFHASRKGEIQNKIFYAYPEIYRMELKIFRNMPKITQDGKISIYEKFFI